MSVIQHSVFIRSIFYNCFVHIIIIYNLIPKFESTQQDRLSNNQNNMIEIEMIIRFPGGWVLLSDLSLDTSHTLDSNYLLDQLQRYTKAVKFWCGDNDILNNVNLQIFLPICQVCYLKGYLSRLIKNSSKNTNTRLYWI